MNPFALIKKVESFKLGEGNLEYFHNRQVKLRSGVLLFCQSGEANIVIDLEKYHITSHTNIILLPESSFRLIDSTPDFKVGYLAYSREKLMAVSFRLNSNFFHFLKEHPCYTHTDLRGINFAQDLIRISSIIYSDKTNRFQSDIIQNLLQIIILYIYDKSEQLFVKDQNEKNSIRQGQLFKNFINLIYQHCKNQRDVAFYAGQLCISTRYLSAIAKQIGGNSAKAIIDEFLILDIKVTLQSTEMSIKEVAEYYNFPDQSFFARYFRKHTGMAPQQCRAKL